LPGAISSKRVVPGHFRTRAGVVFFANTVSANTARRVVKK
jgi:hypothetical protein